MADAVATTLARNRGGIPKGYVIDPVSGQLVPSVTTRQANAPQNVERTDPDGTFWDANGTPWKLVGDTWIQGQKDPITQQWRFANNSINEVLAREGAYSGSIPANQSTEDFWRSGQGAQIAARANPNYGNTATSATTNQLGAYQNLLNDTSQTDAYNAQNNAWQQQIAALQAQAAQGRQDQITRQQGYDQDAINRINDLMNQQAVAAGQANFQQNELTRGYQDQLSGFSGQLGTALGNFNSSMGALNTPFSAQGYGAPVQFDPQGLAMQQQSYNQLQGIAGGSLDYQAQLASLAQAAAVRAQLAQWQTLESDRQNQLDALSGLEADLTGNGLQQQQSALYGIEHDLQVGGRQQQSTLDAILADLQNGQNTTGQAEALERLRHELDTGGSTLDDVLQRLRGELDTGGAYQKEALSRYEALSHPEVTAEERAIANLARQSFEAQDLSLREARDQDLAARGLRGGAASIASALGGQQQLGQDRVNAELGLQAQAVGRSLQGLAGYANTANALRASQLQALGLYGSAAESQRSLNQQALGAFAQQTNQLRAAQQQGLAMANEAANQLREAQQRGLALRADQANAIRASQQQGLAMYWNATAQLRQQNDAVGMFNTSQENDINKFNAGQETQVNMFNAGQANQVNMFNAGQTNQANANNQQTRLSGSIAQGNMANQIRSDNDAINMFNKEQSQITQRFQDQIAFSDLQRRQGLAESTLQGNSGIIGQQAGLAGQGYQAGMANINDPFARTTQVTNNGINAAGGILGIQSNTNALQGAAGQQNFTNALSGFGAFQSGAGVSNQLSEADRQRQLTAQALGTLATRGGYRMS